MNRMLLMIPCLMLLTGCASPAWQLLPVAAVAAGQVDSLAAPDAPLRDAPLRNVATSAPTTPEPIGENSLLLYRFDAPETAGRWAIVNDDVMGGISQANLALSEEGTVLFSGDVSLENNGGFASIRSARAPYGITDEQGVRLTVRGDGKIYRLRLYATSDRRIAYEAPFQTVAGEWQEIDLPFADFEPTIRGFVLQDYGPVTPSEIEGIGIMVRDDQTGEFALEIAAIEAYP